MIWRYSFYYSLILLQFTEWNIKISKIASYKFGRLQLYCANQNNLSEDKDQISMKNHKRFLKFETKILLHEQFDNVQSV